MNQPIYFSIITFTPIDKTGTEYTYFMLDKQIIMMGNEQASHCYHIMGSNIREKIHWM